MNRFAPYLGILAALVFGAFIALFSSGSVTNQVTVTPVATSTLSVVENATTSTVVLPTLAPSITPPVAPTIQSSTTTSKKVPQTPAKIVPQKPVTTTLVQPVATTPPPSPSAADIGLDAASTHLRNALVNILCYVLVGSGLHSISGSGVIVDSKGIILTNAHIAQYFLLLDRGVTCTIRSGSPAYDKYKAALIYISPAWVRANATVLTQVSPTGTGQYDFAFLAITKSSTATPLPDSFPFVPLSTQPPYTGTPIVIGSYGAQFLEATQIQSSLFPTLVFGSVKDIFTFSSNSIDVLALGGSAAAQEGSSGGGVVDASGKLVGTITTSTVEGDTNTRFLDAITASYIRAEYASEMNSSLDALLAESTPFAVSDFAPQIPTLEGILAAQLH